MSKFVYTAAIFVSAFLLFLVQPMFARMALPYLGGAPAVWNTALVFYQATLLLGYLWAHFVAKSGKKTQWLTVHGIALVLAAVMLPIKLPQLGSPSTSGSPVPWLLTLLALGVGLPFFAVSTTSPLLQRWFSQIGHRESANPYFLYAASNFGSLLALLGYPLVFERLMSLQQQSRLWSIGFIVLLALIAACAWFLKKAPEPAIVEEVKPEPVAWLRKARWVALAFVPSSLLMGVTTYISTEIAAVPLLWVVPLAIYLLTFILTFANKKLVPHALVRKVTPFFMVVPLIVTIGTFTEIRWLALGIGFGGFFFCSMLCHGELSEDKPTPAKLTEFFLWMSFGGVLGGLFCGLIAPVVFKQVLEYPIALVLCALLMKREQSFNKVGELVTIGATVLAAIVAVLALKNSGEWTDFLNVATLAIPVVAVLLVVGTSFMRTEKARTVTLDVLLPVLTVASISLGLQTLKSTDHWNEFVSWKAMIAPAIVAALAFGGPVRLALSIAALAAAPLFFGPVSTNRIYQSRSFFGTIVVRSNSNMATLSHGTTLHGEQFRNPLWANEPVSYYHRTGPIGDVIEKRGIPENASVGIVGLGVGTIVSYAKPGQDWTIFEIDPEVVKVAENPDYFTYLNNHKGQYRIVLGDARLQLAASSKKFDLLVLDAYSSDAVPVHLITLEAFQLYKTLLKPKGILAVHISNRYMDLWPVVTAAANELGMSERRRHDLDIGPLERYKVPSIWIAMTNSESDLGALRKDPNWIQDTVPPGFVTWTDGRSSILEVLKGSPFSKLH